MSFKCLNVKIDNLTKREIVERIKFAQNLQVATVNPEFILEAQKDKEFRKILNSKKTLCIADGIGLKFAGWRQGKNLKCRWTGVDLMMEILEIANRKKQRIFLIGNKKGLSDWREVMMIIEKNYPDLKIDGVNVEVAEENDKVLRLKIYKDATLSYQSMSNTPKFQLYISKYNPDIIFCSLGAPYQEKLLYSLRNNTDVKLVMGVGGSFDFLTGKIKRASKWLRIIGMEWFYRLIQEPRYRWRRIFRAIIVFPIRVLFER